MRVRLNVYGMKLDIDEKLCKKCGKVKPIDCFYRDGWSPCRACHNQIVKEWQKKNPKKQKKYKAKSNQKARDRMKNGPSA